MGFYLTIFSFLIFLNLIIKNLLKNIKIFIYFYLLFFRPGGELNAGEDEVEGLKRLLTEVTVSTKPYATLYGS